MKHEKPEHQIQGMLRSKHHELLQDIELVAKRANASRRVTEHAADIVAAAEVALVRVLAEWRASRGGNQNNQFFDPLSKRLRRIIAYYRKLAGSRPRAETPEGERWIYQITNFETLPFERLKPYFRASHVDEAIKMGITLGLRELSGVRIYKDQEHDND